MPEEEDETRSNLEVPSDPYALSKWACITHVQPNPNKTQYTILLLYGEIKHLIELCMYDTMKYYNEPGCPIKQRRWV